MISASGVLRAGGLLPAETPAAAADGVDTIDARAYAHAALGGRAVVRLVSATLGAAEDLALEFLGFQVHGVEASVARGRRQALGFPGWALANDPANGAYALAVVKDMERLARQARAKPGVARAGFEQLGEQLARSVPHFLPTFYEQVGRTFIGAEQPSQAATMFSRAREAERVYGLAVDEERRRDVFVEFALAGALTSKAIDELADQLAASKPAPAAYQAFRELCVQRTLGGVPPSPGMGERLNRMAVAAGLEANAEARAVLRQVIGAPALSRAAAGFWKAYRTPLLELARESPELRGTLLNLFPAPQPRSANFLEWWLELLDRSGAADALTGPAGAVPVAAEPAGGPAAWLSRLVAQHHQGWRSDLPATLPRLVERMAARLRADGVAVDLIGPNSWSADLDLIDLALALGIPLAPPRARELLRVASYGGPQPERDLVHLVEDPVFGPGVAETLETDLAQGYSGADRLPRGAGVQRLMRAWLDRRADHVERGGLPQIETSLAVLAKASERTLGLNPAACARIASADLAHAVARTLRGGIVDELGWAALEAATEKLQPGQYGLRVYETWPNLVLADDHRAIVVGPDRILLEHDLRTPSPAALFFTGGQLLVSWYDSATGSTQAYWTAQPGQTFEATTNLPALSGVIVSVELPNGGRTRGGRAIYAGDTTVPEPAQVLTDGATFWRRGPVGDFHAYDPDSGRVGAASLPTFLQTLVRAGAELDLGSCWLLPAAGGLEDSPLGVADGLLGWGVRKESGVLHGRGIDGRAFTGQTGERRDGRWTPQLVGLVDLPGDETPRPLSCNSLSLSMWSPDGTTELFHASFGAPAELASGSPLVLPPLFWHCLRPRDLVGSQALRTLRDDVARQFFESAFDELTTGESNFPATLSLVERLLPEVTNLRLRVGVLGICVVAARLAQRRAAMEALRAPVPAVQRGGRVLDDQKLRSGLSGLLSERGWAGEPGHSRTIEQIEVVGAVAAGGEPPATVPEAPMPWPQLLGSIGAVAFRAANPATTVEDREALLTFLEVLAETPLVQPGRLRLVEIIDRAAEGPARFSSRVLREGSRTWLTSFVQLDPATNQAVRLMLEFSPDGTFELPPDTVLLTTEYAMHSTWDAERIRTFVGLLRDRGPVAWQPEVVEQLAGATGLSRPEAALVLGALPGIRNYINPTLPSATRRVLGLNARDAAAACEVLARLEGQTLRDVLAAAMPDDPRELWASPNTADRLARAWNAHVERRIALPEELVRQLRGAIKTALPATDVLTACVNPEISPRLNRDVVWTLDGSSAPLWRVAPAGDYDELAFDWRMLTSLAATYAWLFATVPVGDPIRGQLPAILARARARLANRDLLIGPASLRNFSADAAFFDTWPGASFPQVADSRDAGVLIVLRTVAGAFTFAQAILRPAAAFDAAAEQLVPWMDYLRSPYAAARFLLGPGAAVMADRVAHTPVPVGGFEANPALSVPDLVAHVAGTLSLPPDAAAAYLQVLTLAEPTSKNLARWNDWRPKQLGTALDVLVERGLLARGTRARAGRDVFLPGGWEELKAPNLPIEAWKLGLYDGAPLDGRVLPLRPLHELFAAAWHRVQAGDVPAFQVPPEREH